MFAAALSPTGVAAQDEDHPPDPGCALPKINEMVRSVFGPYAAAYHAGGSTPGAQSANGKVRIFQKGMVSCMFFRTASAKSVHQDGTLQFADMPGKTLAFDNDRLLAEVRWATAKGATNESVSGATLEPIARQVLIPK
jgi:hypothetical protein